MMRDVGALAATSDIVWVVGARTPSLKLRDRRRHIHARGDHVAVANTLANVCIILTWRLP
jgi:hypothetical protein